MEQTKIEKIQEELHQLLSSRQSLLLATASAEGLPHISYAPFVVKEQGKYYIHISELAKHYHNLVATGYVSAILIEDEKDAGNIFARKRLTLDGRAHKLAADSAQREEILDLFATKFGNFFNSSLRKQGDFHTFELAFTSGTLVLGFGAAYRLSGEELRQIDWLKGEHGKAGAGLARV